MKRIGLVASAVLALCSLAPARAHSVQGYIRFAAAAPNAQRLGTVTHTMPNGTMGYVIALEPGATNARYTLRLDDGATRLEELDVFFYYGIEGFGDPCPIALDTEQHGATQTGTVCPTNGSKAARYAIVVLNTGAFAEFTFTV